MIQNRVKTAIAAAIITASPLVADVSDYEFMSNSIVGIEGGYSILNYEFGTPTNNIADNISISHVGLKLGAESKDFRVFLSGRYFHDGSSVHDYITTYGIELQYKFNISSAFNAYIGANLGYANMAFRAANETATRTVSDPYYGGDLGINIHLGKSVDWELGGRVMSIQADNTNDFGAGTKTYHINQIISAYTSIIFKWQMD